MVASSPAQMDSEEQSSSTSDLWMEVRWHPQAPERQTYQGKWHPHPHPSLSSSPTDGMTTSAQDKGATGSVCVCTVLCPVALQNSTGTKTCSKSNSERSLQVIKAQYETVGEKRTGEVKSARVAQKPTCNLHSRSLPELKGLH